ncbi:hypothetical protein AB0L00_11325 [Actinoallomurus sp. NPDC052308]
MTVTPPPAGAFDLVSAQYFPLRHQPDHTALRGLLKAVLLPSDRDGPTGR